MERPEIIVQIMFKPNCGLENTRASLIVRRITPLCDSVSTYPDQVKSNRSTIPYLRDNGLFIRFRCATPEWVLLAIKNSFFVDYCVLVDDANVIPPFTQSNEQLQRRSDDGDGKDTLSPFSSLSERDNELVDILNRIDQNRQTLGVLASQQKQNLEFNAAMFEQDRIIGDLRTLVTRTRLEQFDSIAAALHALAIDSASRANVQVALEIEDSHLSIDRATLTSLEAAAKRALRTCIRSSIEHGDERRAAGKPPCATIRFSIENDGSSVTCRLEHDGRPFDLNAVGKLAETHGLLTRPLSAYSDSELEALLPLLRTSFATLEKEEQSCLFEIGEIFAALQRIGGQGEIHNTDRNTVVVHLHIPTPLTAFEIAQVSVGETRLALPAQQIDRFLAYRDMPPVKDNHINFGDGFAYTLINGPGSPSPIQSDNPTLVVLLSAYERHVALIIDSADGYEHVQVHQLPRLLDRLNMRANGCLSYATLSNGSLRPVLNVRYLKILAPSKEDTNA